MKKTFIGYVPKEEPVREIIEHWDKARLSMLTLKQWKEILANNPLVEGGFSRNNFCKRTIVITVKDEEL